MKVFSGSSGAQFVAALLFCLGAFGETGTVLLLHTNDMHDHVRPDYDGTGGLPYLAGYIKQVKSERDDVLLLDAGDVMEKGDLVAFKTQSRMMYEAMGRIGYDAVAPGNHDDAYSVEHLEECKALAPDMDMLCVNLFHEDGAPVFPASKIYEVGKLKIGVIGMVKPRDELSLDVAESAHRIAEEVARLENDAHLIVVVLHLGVRECMEIAKIAPGVDVFVSGHTHSVLKRPVVLKETGALVVQAGSYCEYVGQLELTIDLDTEAIVDYTGDLVQMNHETIPVDQAMLDWVNDLETELCPEAREPVLQIEDSVSLLSLGFMGAEAMRQMAGVEIGFCHTGQIIRDALPKGAVDRNAVFRTGGQRAHDVITTELTGAEITAYLNGLAKSNWGQTQWSGFAADRREVDGKKEYVTNLDPTRRYTVVMAVKEWDTRFYRYFEDHPTAAGESETPLAARFETTPSTVTFTDAVVKFMKDARSETALKARLEKLVEASATL